MHNAIGKPIIHICNASLNQSIYPNRFKFTIMALIYKKGGKTAPSNFQPISSLITSSKIL